MSAIAAFEAQIGELAPFNVGELATATVSMVSLLLVGELVNELSSEFVFVTLDPVLMGSEGSMGLSVVPSVERAERLVPLPLSGWEVPPWFAVEGVPEAQTGLTVRANVTAGVGALRALEPYPDPRNTYLPASLRWLPTTGTMTPLVTSWWPYSKTVLEGEQTTVWELASHTVNAVAEYTVGAIASTKVIVLPNTRDFFTSSPGVNPTYLPTYSYWRAGSYVRNAAMGFRGGDHMWNDAIKWNAEEVTVVAVVVLHRPARGWYSVLETSAPSSTQLQPFFGLRSDEAGQLVLWAETPLASITLDTGQSRPDQPVVVGFNVDMVENTCSLLTVDRAAKVTTSVLPNRYDNRSRLWLGRSPHGDQATASMEVLEVGVFDTRLSTGDLEQILGIYDRMYGVSAS